MVQQIAPEETPETPAEDPKAKTTLTINKGLLSRFRVITEHRGMETKPVFEEMLGVMEQWCSENLIEIPEDGRFVGISEQNFREISTQSVSAEEPFDAVLSRVVRVAQTVLRYGIDPGKIRVDEAFIVISQEHLEWIRSKEKYPDETNRSIVGRLCKGIDDAQKTIDEEYTKRKEIREKYSDLKKKHHELVKKYNRLVKAQASKGA